MTNRKQDPDTLVTEKDIDSEFGLFTAETKKDALPNTEGELEEKYPPKSRTRIGVVTDPDLAELAEDTPIDPAAPPEEFHGTDLLNGAGADRKDGDD
ncbi:hypothetical protein [Paenibacillus beijingensis]|uniref:Uncharacterized protein n=1 Tax=Paenibacillus beijingensis TaxID=1126833 RepID=A0A0D5NMK1_9BACL|nr:hypothetical protein [Paenibacillus beijingensis]AJY76128.1 hypothetical protein VN24_18145 [Paenibacillus beijingensis]